MDGINLDTSGADLPESSNTGHNFVPDRRSPSNSPQSGKAKKFQAPADDLSLNERSNSNLDASFDDGKVFNFNQQD